MFGVSLLLFNLSDVICDREFIRSMIIFLKDYFNKVFCDHDFILHRKSVVYPFTEELGGGVTYYIYLCKKCGHVRKVKLK